MNGKLILKDGTILEGVSFGAERATPGEVVFSTGMVGYPESLTDPSFAGQILVFTYPILGSYGVPHSQYWESESIKASGVIVSNYIDTPSHFQSKTTLSEWFKKEGIPALEVKDTRALAQRLRDNGAILGKIIFDKDIEFHDPNTDNLVAMFSVKEPVTMGDGKKTIVLIDCGAKKNITRNLLQRGVRVITVPWDYDVIAHNIQFDGIVISNGPGDPKKVPETIQIVKKALELKKPVMGICLGNQILALASGADTYKLKFGHRGQNQPCQLVGTKRCYLTTQNHGFAV
ncbi:glutamine-hydrolyzing carbamoyl-phosphate synthase small subunit, partial [Candidatus Roizmanbacteria bacterium]|nr:glutamine-hydrolyzing carbamoyl-phosphate synthase small subunit [Candidatus Roizmanbacteria bacterium]